MRLFFVTLVPWTGKRGIDGLISLSDKMGHLPIPGRIIVIGDGDFSSELIRAGEKIDNIDYLGKITQLSEVERIMDTCHVGIMPMPDIEIWRFLVQSNYLNICPKAWS